MTERSTEAELIRLIHTHVPQHWWGRVERYVAALVKERDDAIEQRDRARMGLKSQICPEVATGCPMGSCSSCWVGMALADEPPKVTP